MVVSFNTKRRRKWNHPWMTRINSRNLKTHWGIANNSTNSNSRLRIIIPPRFPFQIILKLPYKTIQKQQLINISSNSRNSRENRVRQPQLQQLQVNSSFQEMKMVNRFRIYLRLLKCTKRTRKHILDHNTMLKAISSNTPWLGSPNGILNNLNNLFISCHKTSKKPLFNRRKSKTNNNSKT